MPPVTFSMTLSPIVPSLQAAATNMTGPEFCSLTEQVRDHLLSGNTGELKSLLAGRKIEASREVLGQIALGRASFFDEAVSAKVLAAIAAAPTAEETEKEAKILRYLGDLASNSPVRRRMAAAYFTYQPDPRAFEPLIEALDYRSSRMEVLTALARLDAPEAVQPIIQILMDTALPTETHKQAVQTLSKIGAPSVGPLIALLANGVTKVQDDARRALVGIGASAVDPLIEALEHPDANVRRLCSRALGELRRSSIDNDLKCRSLLPLRARATQDVDSSVRSAAADAIEKIWEYIDFMRAM